MSEYRVIWEINLEAKDPIAAAETALAIQRDPESLATAFRTIDKTGKIVFVDLKRDALPDLRKIHIKRRRFNA